MPSGEVLLAGGLPTKDPDDSSDAYLAVAIPTGITWMHPSRVRGEQRIEGLAASPNGLVWLLVDIAVELV
jgi:hypothetical protein